MTRVDMRLWATSDQLVRPLAVGLGVALALAGCGSVVETPFESGTFEDVTGNYRLVLEPDGIASEVVLPVGSIACRNVSELRTFEGAGTWSLTVDSVQIYIDERDALNLYPRGSRDYGALELYACGEAAKVELVRTSP